MSYCFIGNSHLDQFANAPHILKLYKMGASIKGLVNPTSTLRLRDDIYSFTQSNPNTKLVFFLGQVDIEFGYYYKCVMDQKKYDMEEYIDGLLDKYMAFLHTLNVPCIVLSINPHVLKENYHIYRICFTEDNGREGFYSQHRPDLSFESEKVQNFINDSFETRVSHTQLFNKKLQHACLINTIQFVDFWDFLFEDGVLRQKYVPKGVDHHLAVRHDVKLTEHVMNKIKILSQ